MKKHLAASLLLAASIIIGASQPSYALLDIARSDTRAPREAQSDNQAQPEREGDVLSATQTDELEQRRMEIQQKIQAKRDAVTERLSGRRAEICEQKEQGINQAIAARNASAQRYFDKFKAIQERLTSFASEKKLEIKNASALELIMNDKRDETAATISAANATTFDCAMTSASNPGHIIRELVQEEKNTLLEYRAAVKDYALAVKAAAQSIESSSTTETSPESTSTRTETTNSEVTQ